MWVASHSVGGEKQRHLSRGPPTPLLRALLYLLRDRTGRLRFEKAEAHGADVMNNLANKLANEGRARSRPLDISSLTVPDGWVDDAPVLCHQPLDYLTKLVVRAQVGAPAKTLKFEAFSNRWMVTLGHMFGVVLDPGNYIKAVWSLTIPEGMKEVLWKEMNGAQVLGHRYYGRGHERSDMGRFCPCGLEVSLGHILIGCDAYRLQPLMTVLLEALNMLHPGSSFKTLSPDSWGTSPWYPLLALRSLEETAYPIVKGRKEVLKGLKKSRQQREWMIGNYWWALWKWRMKEIHDTSFTFMPANCVASIRDILAMPVPAHMVPLPTDDKGSGSPHDAPPNQASAPLLGDLTKLPPPVSSLLGGVAEAQPASRGKLILRALRSPIATERTHHLSRRDVILRALMDDAYA